MATHPHPTRFSYRTERDRTLPDAVWWPEGRTLADQLPQLVSMWPARAGHIARILYSPPDWDDRPRQVDVGGRIMKTGCFPQDDTHLVTLTLANGERRTVRIIQPDTGTDDARAILDQAASDDNSDWDSEGGHPDDRAKALA